ncbi:MAG: hypothetical protein KGO49_14055 [Gammaproteobacteria bacterium]|nr:hypothetical protein [Gammaproteobacteria bacterium]
MDIRIRIVFLTMLTALATSSHAQTFCVFDPLGASGDNYSMMKDYVLAAKKWGADIKLKSYTDESVAAKDFKDGRCEGAAISGIRTRQFNNFVGSIDAVGAVISNESARMVYSLMASPKLAPDMLDHGVEVAGVTTLGLAYVMVDDRKINSLWNMVGKRWGVLSYDVAQQLIVNKVGATPVNLELNSIGAEFNNGQVDLVALPMMAFKPLELNHGIGANGAILNFPVAQVTYDILIHPEKFAQGYGQKSRSWMLGQLDHQFSVVKKTEDSIDPKYWENIPAKLVPGYYKLMRDVRLFVTSDNVYNKKMMHILKRVRCRENPNNVECNLNAE